MSDWSIHGEGWQSNANLEIEIGGMYARKGFVNLRGVETFDEVLAKIREEIKKIAPRDFLENWKLNDPAPVDYRADNMAKARAARAAKRAAANGGVTESDTTVTPNGNLVLADPSNEA